MNPLSIDSLPTLSRLSLMGMSGLALADLLTRQAWANTAGNSSILEPHFPARAKRMIFILLDGGLSQVDSPVPVW